MDARLESREAVASMRSRERAGSRDQVRPQRGIGESQSDLSRATNNLPAASAPPRKLCADGAFFFVRRGDTERTEKTPGKLEFRRAAGLCSSCLFRGNRHFRERPAALAMPLEIDSVCNLGDTFLMRLDVASRIASDASSGLTVLPNFRSVVRRQTPAISGRNRPGPSRADS